MHTVLLHTVVRALRIGLLIVLVIRPLSVFVMFGRNKLFRHVENRLSVPVPERGAAKSRCTVSSSRYMRSTLG